ncbi:MAG: hypothetical protein U1F98_01745 [Verrucomicrobiota bacterium]
MSFKKKTLILSAILVAWALVMAVTLTRRHQNATYADWLARYKTPESRTNAMEFAFTDRDDPAAIRSNFVHMLDVMLRARIAYQPKRSGAAVPGNLRMAWSEGDVLYIQNPACYLDAPENQEKDTWVSWLDRVKAREKMPVNDSAFYHFAHLSFDRVVIKGEAEGGGARFPDATIPLGFGDSRDGSRLK